MKVFVKTHESLIDTALLLLRLALGVVFFAHGAQKVLGLFGGKGLGTTVSMMSGTFGPVLPYLTAFTEFLGGIFMIFGLLTRFWGIGLTINMLVAVIAVHAKNGFFAPTGFEFPLSLLFIALAITIAGPGRFSLDHAFFASNTTATKRSERFAVPAGSVQFKPHAKSA